MTQAHRCVSGDWYLHTSNIAEINGVDEKQYNLHPVGQHFTTRGWFTTLWQWSQHDWNYTKNENKSP